MCIKSLAEGIILQSIEDLFSNEHSTGSLDFFSGEEFRSCAEMAGMSLLEQVKVLHLIRKVADYQTARGILPHAAQYGSVKPELALKSQAACSQR